MYQIVYYIKTTNGLSYKEQEYSRHETAGAFRLRRNALHYVIEILKQDYIEQGFAADQIVGGIYCYKSEKTAQGDRKITEIMVKVEKG